jgi:hypothetical protein
MNQRLRSPTQLLKTPMRVSIPAQEHRLEKEHDRVPDRRCPAEERQQQFANERLDRKKQNGAQENRRAENGGQ